jgi:hypothetical protein
VFLWSRSIRRGSAVRLNEVPREIGHLELATNPREDELLRQWIDQMQFQATFDFDFSRAAHVNVQEAVALRRAVERACKDPKCRGARMPVMLDSMVVSCVASRGGSSSRAVNIVFVVILPFLLCCNVPLLPF